MYNTKARNLHRLLASLRSNHESKKSSKLTNPEKSHTTIFSLGLIAHATGSAKRSQNCSRYRSDDLYNPLKSFFLSNSSLKFNVSEI